MMRYWAQRRSSKSGKPVQAASSSARPAGYQESLITVPLGRDVSVDRSLTALPKPAEPTHRLPPRRRPPPRPKADRQAAGGQTQGGKKPAGSSRVFSRTNCGDAALAPGARGRRQPGSLRRVVWASARVAGIADGDALDLGGVRHEVDRLHVARHVARLEAVPDRGPGSRIARRDHAPGSKLGDQRHGLCSAGARGSRTMTVGGIRGAGGAGRRSLARRADGFGPERCASAIYGSGVAFDTDQLIGQPAQGAAEVAASAEELQHPRQPRGPIGVSDRASRLGDQARQESVWPAWQACAKPEAAPHSGPSASGSPGGKKSEM